MIAESLAQYRIIKKLGVGGMGEVYLAHDTKLDRKVAIKVLSADMLANENAKKRLIREAQAAAKLDHPNICAIYDVNEVDSQNFIVMQYVEGETLAERMRQKRLPLSTALDVARQTAEALAEAHAHGLVHRDIKPQNIMITPRGQVKILDFGLCKQLPNVENVANEAPTMSLLSVPGLIIGTIPYMSPEQLSGEPVDAASDIFSLGVTFYEMLAGKHPFKAPSAAVTMSQILTKEVFPNEQLTETSPELQNLLEKMLNKERGQRYQSATELLADLKHLAPSQLSADDETRSFATGTRELAVTPPQTSYASGVFDLVGRYKWAALASLLAVIIGALGVRYFLSGETLDSLAILPFTYVSSDAQLMANPDHEYLSDGFTESIINNLSQLPDLKVIARSSVFRYKGKNLDDQAIGRELNVRAVLTGQIRQEGNELTIKAELMDVQNNRQLWFKSYQRTSADIQTIQKELARDVSTRLRLKLTDADQTHLAKTNTDSGEAYEAYLKGRYHWNKRTDEGFKQATKFFQEAIDKDPNYALAYTGLADCYTLRSDYGFLDPGEGYALAKGWATLALKYDNTLAEAHTSLASIKAVTEWDWQGAEDEYRRAIELNPNYATAHHWYAVQLLLMGKVDQALLEIKKAQQLDPLSLGINKDFAVVHLFARDYDKALEQCRKTLEIEPSFLVMSTYIAQVYELKQKYPEAISELEKAHAAAPDDGEINYGLAQAYALGGKVDQAKKISNDLSQSSKQNTFLPKEAAYLQLLLGQKDEAVLLLQTAYKDHNVSVAEIKMDPRFDGLRPDPRVAQILQDIGLAQ
ncbi:MAG: protein kinase domain-containing protein [Pyrinomonadaceae bacterium]